MSPRDALLQAAVHTAYDLRGTDAFGNACANVYDCWARWPLIEYARAIERAAELLEQGHADDERLLAWYASIGMLEEDVARAA